MELRYNTTMVCVHNIGNGKACMKYPAYSIEEFELGEWYCRQHIAFHTSIVKGKLTEWLKVPVC